LQQLAEHSSEFNPPDNISEIHELSPPTRSATEQPERTHNAEQQQQQHEQPAIEQEPPLGFTFTQLLGIDNLARGDVSDDECSGGRNAETNLQCTR
jgi:hypothetical protein